MEGDTCHCSAKVLTALRFVYVTTVMIRGLEVRVVRCLISYSTKTMYGVDGILTQK